MAVSTRRARTVKLSTGTLRLELSPSSDDVAPWLDFAARRNPKRGFLFVSRVIGRYLPAAPSRLDLAAERLLAGLTTPPGPVLVVAVAEAGVALGHAVHRRLVAAGCEAVLWHSSRHRLAVEPWLRFEEPHSHGPHHLLHRAADPELARLRDHARSLFLVDDELTTGRTLRQLAGQLAARLPQLERTHALTLSDWSGGSALVDGRPARALVVGRYRFRSGPDAERAMPKLGGCERVCEGLRDEGRRGLRRPIELSIGPTTPGERVLVLGFDEHQGGPLALARGLCEQGADAWFQCLTRAPVRIGAAIESARAFADPYGEGMAQHLYNFRRRDWDRVLVCTETGTVDPALLEATGGVEHRWA